LKTLSLLGQLKQKEIHVLDIKVGRGTLGAVGSLLLCANMRSALILSMIVMSVLMGCFNGVFLPAELSLFIIRKSGLRFFTKPRLRRAFPARFSYLYVLTGYSHKSQARIPS